jgi:hypothetical protein
MAGGIYPGRPFSFNLKCVVFSALVAGGYWYLPPRRRGVLAFLVWSPYLALAWYDYKYGCRDKLEPTLVPFGRRLWLPFKPAGYKAAFRKMAAAQVETMNRVDHLVGWTLLVAGAVAAVRLARSHDT